jgi:hypothetical protein
MEVDSINLRRHERIATFAVFVIPEMRHADDERATLFFAQLLHHVASRNTGSM